MTPEERDRRLEFARELSSPIEPRISKTVKVDSTNPTPMEAWEPLQEGMCDSKWSHHQGQHGISTACDNPRVVVDRTQPTTEPTAPVLRAGIDYCIGHSVARETLDNGTVECWKCHRVIQPASEPSTPVEQRRCNAGFKRKYGTQERNCTRELGHKGNHVDTTQPMEQRWCDKSSIMQFSSCKGTDTCEVHGGKFEPPATKAALRVVSDE